MYIKVTIENVYTSIDLKETKEIRLCIIGKSTVKSSTQPSPSEIVTSNTHMTKTVETSFS